MTTKQSEYPLEANNLQNIATFEHTSAGLSLVSKISAPAGSHFTFISSHEPQEKPTWKTIQTSATTHTNPCSALLYMNHSCDPSLELHMFSPDKNGKYPVRNGDVTGVAGEVRVARHRDLRAGEALTFFYPSTEWEFDRGFDCLCGAPGDICLGKVQGAKALDRKTLDKWFFNQHILDLARERDAE